MSVKNIFFDFDGVLAESVQIKTEAFYKMYLSHGEDFAQRVVEFHKAHGGVSRFDKIKKFNGEWLGESLNEDRIQELAGVFSSYVVDGVVNSDEVKGAQQFLDNSDKYVKYVITGTPTNEIEQILDRRNMTHYFKRIGGSPRKKDYWVERFLNEDELNAEECIFVGDAKADYKAAQAFDVTFVLRETEDGKQVFKDYNGYKMDDMTGLAGIIEQINSKL